MGWNLTMLVVQGCALPFENQSDTIVKKSKAFLILMK